MKKINHIFLIVLMIGMTFSLAGTITSPVRAQTDDINLGILGPLAITPGIDNERGVLLAVEEINADGGVDVGGTSRNFKTFSETTSGTTGLPEAGTATNSLSKLIDEDDVIAIIGGFRTEVVVAMQANLNNNPVPFLGVGSTSPIISEYYWRLGPSNGTQLARGLIEFYIYYMAAGLGTVNITIVREEAAWTIALGGGVKGGLIALAGLSFDEDIVIPTSASAAAVESAMTPLKDSASTAILHLFSAPVGKFVTEAWANLDLPQYLSGINVESQQGDFFADTEGKAYGEIEFETLPPDIDDAFGDGDAFRVAYNDKYGVTPTYTAVAGYNAVYVLADAITRAGTTDLDNLQSALAETDYQGAFIKYKFTSEPGSQPGRDASGALVNITGAPLGITVHDLFTSATVGVRGQPYAQGYMAQWGKDGVKKTVYFDKPFTTTPDTGDAITAPINHSDFGIIPSTGGTGVPGYELPVVILLLGSIATIVNIKRRKKH